MAQAYIERENKEGLRSGFTSSLRKIDCFSF